MNKNGEIIIIEDDQDDQDLLSDVFNELKVPNRLVFFSNGELALEYLEKNDSEPFLILSDVNLPKLNGFELREKIFSSDMPGKKSIPYIFFTTSASRESVMNAYAFSAQGFFKKPVSFNELQAVIHSILDYWKRSYSPSDF